MAEWRNVKSTSGIKRIRYFRKNKILAIEFETVIGAYADVGWKTYLGFLHADSKGRYHWRHIRGKFYYQPISIADAQRIGLVAPEKTKRKES